MLTAYANSPLAQFRCYCCPISSLEAPASHSWSQPMFSKNVFGQCSQIPLVYPGGVEAVGWDFTVEEDKGRRVMEGLREVFKEGVMQVMGRKEILSPDLLTVFPGGRS